MKTPSITTIDHTQKKTIERYCDICECDMDDVNDSWERNEAAFYWFNRTVNEGKQLDICPLCMKTKIIPFIESKFGIKSRKIEFENIYPVFF